MRLTGTVMGSDAVGGVGLIAGDDGNYYLFSVREIIKGIFYDFPIGTRVAFTSGECGPAAVDIVPVKEEPPNRGFLEVSPLDPRGLFNFHFLV